MTIFQASFLGLVEGITEFLPVSSTAHLLLVQRFFGITSPSLFFDIMVQMGALGAVIVYFWKKLMILAKETLVFLKHLVWGKVKLAPENFPLGLSLLIASLPVFFTGFILRKKIESIHESTLIIAIMSVAVGVLLMVAEKQAKREGKKIQSKNLIAMGFYQVLALIPGTSRSGITIAGGLFEGLSFSQALEYSFLIGIPSLGGAGVFELLSAAREGIDKSLIFPTLVGMVVSFVSALLVVHFLLWLVRKTGFMPFVIYRFAFGAIALLFR